MYDGFISYSHAADDLLAPRLQSALQRFAKPWWKRRAVRIFRDESSLSANPHLWSSITEALDTSGWFVLLLSPDAAESEWVNQEITYWVENRDPKKILPVVTDGTFGWTDDVMTGTAVPAALQGVFSEEPRWVDLRFAKGEEQLDVNNPTFSAVVADIASAIRGVPKDELESEEVRQHRRTVRTAWAAGSLLTVLAIAAIGFGIQSANNARLAQANAQAETQARTEAETQRNLAQKNEQTAIAERERADQNAADATASAQLARGRELAAASVAVLDKDPELAVLLGLEAARHGELENEGVQALRAAVAEHKTLHHLEWTHPGVFTTWVAMSSDGTLLAVGGLRHNVEVWDIGGSEPVRLWLLDELEEGWFPLFTLTEDGKYLVVQPVWDGWGDAEGDPSDPSLDGSTLFYDARTGERVSSYGPPEADCQRFPWGYHIFNFGTATSANATWWLLDWCDGSLRRFPVDPFTGEVIGDARPVENPDVAHQTDNGWIYDITAEGFVYENVETGERRVFEDSEELAFNMTPMSPSGGFLVGDGAVYDAETQEIVFTYMPANFEYRDRWEHPCGRVTFSESETRAFVHCEDGSVRAFDTASGRLIDGLYGHEGWAYIASSNANGSLLATGAPDGTRVWDVDRARGTRGFDVAPGYKADASLDLVGTTAAVLSYPNEYSSPIDNVQSALLDATPGQAVVFDTDTGTVLSRIEHVGGKVVRLSPDGKLVAAQAADKGPVAIYDASTGRIVREMTAVCADRGEITDCTIAEPLSFASTDMAWSPDGRHLALGAGRTRRLVVWDVGSGEAVFTSDPIGDIHPVSAVQYSPAGDLVAVSSKDGMRVYDTSDWSEITAISHPGQPSLTMQFTPNGSRLVTAQAHHGLLRIYDTASWEETDISTGAGQTRDLDMSDDGRLVALSNNAGFVHIVDISSGELVDSYPLPGADVTNVEFAGDGTHLLVTDAFGPVEVLPLVTDELIDLARSRLARTFSEEECLTYRIDPCPTLEEMRDR